ncbi:lipoprotein insertase outer membrane protein LolB [Colwellia sp. RSH04]|uniref:lipoprotein insertase outer membrane protein LolB n=1 Tax=Colwellia sp. RSH04 TaxID=2305464 RepID=UPI000E579AB3|nr:lipoprotein insertase outer membrane protein LolB [Colwellia sp. RSH04]RHW75428.1 outer membrane lipoprotein LolB [Colwellia sp. RSH04]
MIPNHCITTLVKTSFSFLILFITACSTVQTEQSLVTNVSAQQRVKQIDIISQWKLSGKIAFLQGDSRERANIYWSIDESIPSQKLNLSSYLGINILQLNSKKDHHTIKLDGKQYNGDNLDYLIEELTGLTLPTQALKYWLKGIPYSNTKDSITFDAQTGFPKSLQSSLVNSYGQEQQWLINYSRYKMVNNIALATKFTIKTQDLTIRIAIDKWQLNT